MDPTLIALLDYGNNQAAGQTYQVPSGYGFSGPPLVSSSQLTKGSISGALQSLAGSGTSANTSLILIVAIAAGIALVALK